MAIRGPCHVGWRGPFVPGSMDGTKTPSGFRDSCSDGFRLIRAREHSKAAIVMHIKLTKSLLVLATLGLTISTAHAVVLVSYEFTGASAAQTSGTATGSDVTFGAFTGQDGSSNVGFSSSSNSMFVRWDATDGLNGDTLAEAITNEAFATFTLTNSTGQTVDLTNLTFDVFFDPLSTNSNYFATRTIFAMADLSGFTSGDELGSVTYADGLGPTVTDTPDTITVDLSSLSNLAAGNDVEFRLYFVDDSDHNDQIYRVDNLTVNGTVIPEPSAVLLGGLGLLALLRRRRR